MAEDGTAKSESAESLQKASEMLARITALKEQAEGAAQAAEQANSKANSESGFAYNAKQNAEEHAKAISQVRGTVDADFTWLTTTKNNADEVSQGIARAKTSSEADAQSIAKAKASAEQDVSLVAAARDSATSVSAAITKIHADIGKLLENASADAASVTEARATVEASAATVQSLQAQVTEGAAKAQSDGATIAKHEAAAQEKLRSMNELVTGATAVQERVSRYEENLAKLNEQFSELHAKTEALLPGATSAGLASAFRDQKARFDRTQRNWLMTFVVAIGLLLIAGFVGLPGLWPGDTMSWDSILRHVVNRLPLVAPLVWLGVYAGRNYMLALRLQEEYAFKEALSATFEGYKREMAGIAGAEPSALPILTLCENVLLTLAQRPGRIYEGHQEDITPLAPLGKSLATTAAALKETAAEIKRLVIKEKPPS